MPPVDAAEFQTYDVWEKIAPTWAKRRAFVEGAAAPVRDWMLRQLAPRPGETLLELAAGVGETGLEAARALGDDGRLIATDLSPTMLDAARRRGRELGAENVEYRTVDAERIDLDADSVDCVICRYGYMLMDDPAAALAETRRVLRPGGRLVLAVFGPPNRNPFFALVVASLVEQGHMPPPRPDAPGIFSMANEERTAGLLRHAGFTNVRIDELPAPRFRLADVNEYLTLVADTAGPVGLTVRALTARDREHTKSRLREALEPFAAEHGYELPGVTLGAVAS